MSERQDPWYPQSERTRSHDGSVAEQGPSRAAARERGCPPCQFETPILREADETYRNRGFELVAVNVQETVDTAAGYADRYSLRHPIGADVSGDILHAYNVYALPTQFFIDADAIIRDVVNGPLSLQGAASRFEAILPKLP